MKKLFVAMLLVSIYGCEDEIGENKELSKELIGEWRSLSVKIKMNTYKNTDSVKNFEVDASNWEKVMKIKPIRTFFKADGTFNSEHWNLKDSLIFNPAGKWVIIGDSLSMTDTFPQAGTNYKYRLLIKNSLGEFYSIEDCDGDGIRDDEYFGQQWKELPK